MKKIVLATILVAILMSLITPTATANPRPFAPYLWAREMVIPCFAFGIPDQEIGKFVEGIVVEPTLISLEQGEVKRVFFDYKGYDGEVRVCFFRLNDLVEDPRETEWWQRSLVEENKGKTLWSRVTRAAKTEGHPDLTKAIISDMVREGVTTWKEVDDRRMTSERLDEVMRAYTDLIED